MSFVEEDEVDLDGPEMVLEAADYDLLEFDLDKDKNVADKGLFKLFPIITKYKLSNSKIHLKKESNCIISLRHERITPQMGPSTYRSILKLLFSVNELNEASMFELSYILLLGLFSLP